MQAVPGNLAHSAYASGIRLGLPIALSFFIFGMTFGVAMAGRDIGPFFAGLASTIVFSGSSQFLILNQIGDVTALATIAISVFLLNVRHIVMGATLLAKTPDRPFGLKLAALLFMIDETWAVAMSPEGERDRLKVLVGCGIVAMLGWVSGSVAGSLLSGFIIDPKFFGIDFVYYSVFLFILASFARQGSVLVPWCVAVGLALLVQAVLPGKWYVVAGGIGGALAGGAMAWKHRTSS